jgi:hypothetical protein
VTVELDLVWKEGPRALWRQSGTLLYIGTCSDCNIACPPTHRIDAEDWADWHDCTVEPVDGD